MSLADNYAPTKDLGDASTVVYTADWDPISTDYVEVYYEDVTTGVQTLQSAYTAERLSNGTLKVTLDAVATSSNYVILSRNTPEAQTQPFSTSSGFQALVVEATFDKLVAMIQELKSFFARTLSFPLGTSATISTEIPVPVAGKALIGSSDGLSFEASETSIDDLDTALEEAEAFADASEASASAAALAESGAETAETNASNSAIAAAASAASITIAAIIEANNPIGTIRAFGVATNPEALLGFTSTWTAVEGTVIVGIAGSGTFDTLDGTGGAETVDLSHDHGGTTEAASYSGTQDERGPGTSGANVDGTWGIASDLSATQSVLQPYIVKYVWQRTA